MAPYGILQSLVRERDLTARCALGRPRAARAAGRSAIDLVPDLPRWAEYERTKTALAGADRPRRTRDAVESVRQDRRRAAHHLRPANTSSRAATAARHVSHFSLTFRTLSVPQMTRRLERAGFRVDAVLGDYQGGPWDTRADVWVILASRR